MDGNSARAAQVVVEEDSLVRHITSLAFLSTTEIAEVTGWICPLPVLRCHHHHPGCSRHHIIEMMDLLLM